MRRAVIGRRMVEHSTPDRMPPAQKSHTQMEHGSDSGSSRCTLRGTNDRLVGVALNHAQKGRIELAADGGLEVVFYTVEQRPAQGETEEAGGGWGWCGSPKLCNDVEEGGGCARGLLQDERFAVQMEHNLHTKRLSCSTGEFECVGSRVDITCMQRMMRPMNDCMGLSARRVSSEGQHQSDCSATANLLRPWCPGPRTAHLFP